MAKTSLEAAVSCRNQIAIVTHLEDTAPPLVAPLHLPLPDRSLDLRAFCLTLAPSSPTAANYESVTEKWKASGTQLDPEENYDLLPWINLRLPIHLGSLLSVMSRRIIPHHKTSHIEIVVLVS